MELNQRATIETRKKQRDARLGQTHSNATRELIRTKAVARAAERRRLGLPDSAPNSLLHPLAPIIREATLETGYDRAQNKEDGRELRIVDGDHGHSGVQLR